MNADGRMPQDRLPGKRCVWLPMDKTRELAEVYQPDKICNIYSIKTMLEGKSDFKPAWIRDGLE